MLDGMSDSIQRSRIENLHSREVDRQSPTGLIFLDYTLCKLCKRAVDAAKVLTNRRLLSSDNSDCLHSVATSLYRAVTSDARSTQISSQNIHVSS